MSTQQPESLRLANVCSNLTRYSMEAHLIAAELRRLHAENETLQAGYDAARLEIDHLRGVTKMVAPAQPVAWLVYLPSIDTQNVYDSQDDPGHVDDVTNHADAEVTPLYEMAAPKAEVAPAGEYPPLPEHAALIMRGKPLHRNWIRHVDTPVFTADQMRTYADATCAMRAQAAPAAVAGQCEDAIELLGKYKELCEEIKRGDSYHIGRIDAAISVLAQAAPVAQGDAEDGARYRWLREHKALNNTHCWHFQGGPIIPGLLTLDAAIDAARKQGANHD